MSETRNGFQPLVLAVATAAAKAGITWRPLRHA